jgi:DNA polymerase V
MEKWFTVIDLKSFYASVECHKRGLDPFKTPLVVCDETKGPGALVLSVTPYLKERGCRNIMRRFELPKDIKLIYARPNMEEYVKESTAFNALLLDYFAPEDWHPYSIDETFIYLSPYLSLYKKTPYEIVRNLLQEVLDKLGLYATAGIGPNMFLAKVALDTDAKSAPDRIALWTKDDIENRLWKIEPITKIWGINVGYERRLAKLGIHNMYDLAHYPKDKIKEELGVIGEQLHEHANGIDTSLISEEYVPQDQSFTSGQVLHRDYSKEELPLLIREMNDEICYRLRKANVFCTTIALTIGEKSPGGRYFSKRRQLIFPTNDPDLLYEGFIEILKTFDIKQPVRQIFLATSGLQNIRYIQMSLLDDNERTMKNEKMYKALDKIKEKYGDNVIFRADARREESTYFERANQIGGHKK